MQSPHLGEWSPPPRRAPLAAKRGRGSWSKARASCRCRGIGSSGPSKGEGASVDRKRCRGPCFRDGGTRPLMILFSGPSARSSPGNGFAGTRPMVKPPALPWVRIRSIGCRARFMRRPAAGGCMPSRRPIWERRRPARCGGRIVILASSSLSAAPRRAAAEPSALNLSYPSRLFSGAGMGTSIGSFRTACEASVSMSPVVSGLPARRHCAASCPRSFPTKDRSSPCDSWSPSAGRERSRAPFIGRSGGHAAG